MIFYETFAAAKADAVALEEKRTSVDQVNIVIRADGNMDDAELVKFGKVFAGAAWMVIHERRVTDGWYNDPH